ncbi:MAG TPA: sigma-70 family RNA polymerase sigma factor [Herpetosiphonaceae bacterium]|nr:sigma-70 family RNA polymerase sigma factor [Herpetosiphonaceae bacterium]
MADAGTLQTRFGMRDSDTEVLERMRHGDEAAFEELFLRHYAQVYRVLYHLLDNRQEAEDLVQETFLTLFRQPPPRTEVPLPAWLCRVALNRGYNVLRSDRRERARLPRLVEPDTQLDPQVESQRREDRRRVRATLASNSHYGGAVGNTSRASAVVERLGGEAVVSAGRISRLCEMCETNYRQNENCWTLAELPERQSSLLLLRYAGLSYAEIETVLELAPGSVGTLLARAERAFMSAYERATMTEHDH